MVKPVEPSNTDGEDQIDPVLQAFADARGRTAVFLLIPNESLHWNHALQIRLAIEGKRFEDLDLVVHSWGGKIAPAYAIIRMLRSHTNGKLNACIPLRAMSAATLLCLGADKIILDELANLGPLDVQVPEEGKNKYKSALNPFKSLEELTNLTKNTVYGLYGDLMDVQDLAKSDCFEIAIKFVEAVNGCLLTKLDSEKLGEYRRSLSEGEDYGKRVLSQLSSWSPDKIQQVIEKLVYQYPSHDYVIDYYELQKLGFQVELFAEETEKSAVIDLIKCLWNDKTIIGTETTIRIVKPLNNINCNNTQPIPSN